MTKTVTIDIEKLKAIANESDSAKAVFKYLFGRRRGRGDTNLKRVRRILKEEGTTLERSDIAAVFKKLQDLGVGKYTAGRNGGADRFKWDANLRSIKDVLEGKATGLKKQLPPSKKLNLPKLVAAVEQSTEQKPIAPVEPPKPAASVSVSGGHMVVIRKGDTILEVPADLTPAESKGVASLFKELSLAS